MTMLLDASLLIPLLVPDHTHHSAGEAWFSTFDGDFATCPITQGAVLRFVIRGGATASDGLELLSLLTDSPRHEFWADDVGFSSISLRGVLGHKQVTDAYLSGLARAHRGRVGTFDAGLASLHPDVVVLVPGSGQAGGPGTQSAQRP